MNNVVVELSKQTCELLLRRNEKRYRGYQTQIEGDPGFQEYIAQLIALSKGSSPEALNKGRRVKPPRTPVHKFSAGLEAEIIALRPLLGKQLRTDEVFKMLEDRAFRFTSKDHRKAVKDALHRMVKKELLKRIENGVFEFN
jgi:hypothetical protein